MVDNIGSVANLAESTVLLNFNYFVVERAPPLDKDKHKAHSVKFFTNHPRSLRFFHVNAFHIREKDKDTYQ